MKTRREVLVFGCRDEDIAVLEQALDPETLSLRVVNDGAEFARLAVLCRPVAAVVGLGKESTSPLELLAAVRAIRHSLRVIAIADEESLELERTAREKSVFYYLVRPIEAAEIAAVVQDAMRSTKE